MAAWAIKHGYKTGAVTFSVESSAQTLKNIVVKTFEANGGKILLDENLSIGQTSYRSEVTRVNAAHPQVVFLQTEPVSAGPYFSNWKELNALSVPFIGSDLTAGGDFITAVTPALANAHIVSAVGSALGGGGTASFNKYYSQSWHAQPLAGANYAYDGVLDLALAMDKAGSTSPAAVVKAIPEVSNPPGALVATYPQGVADLKAGKKINYEGASGPTDYNKFHNVYGPFDVVQATLSGNPLTKTLYTFSAKQLQCMTAGKGLSC
jgi:ABC-type branched-subunit amino acid transport system substrate-binding protein